MYIVTLAGACKESYRNRVQAIDICKTYFLPNKLLLFPVRELHRQRNSREE